MTNTITTIYENFINAEQPEKITLTLKSHQLKLLKKCQELEKGKIVNEDNGDIVQTSMGVIGDTVGSGKSLVMLSIISNKLPDDTIIPQQICNKYYSISRYNPLFNVSHLQSNTLTIDGTGNNDAKTNMYRDISILVVPHNIFIQWKGYIENNTTITAEFMKIKKDLKNYKGDKEMVLISSSLYKEFSTYCIKNALSFARVLIDEADSINIPACKQIKARFYWFVTSSINNLLKPVTSSIYVPATINTPSSYKRHPGVKYTGFIKETFKGLLPKGGYYDRKYIFLKNCDDFVKRSFALPEPINIKYMCKNNKLLYVLESLISPNVQQMICAGDIESAIKTMEIEKAGETNLIKIVANNLYDDLENKKIDLDSTYKKTYKQEKSRKDAIIRIKEQIVNIEKKIENIKKRINEAYMDPITMCEIENPTIIKCCNQVFDFESITIYMTTKTNPTCPMCRTIITKESLILLAEDSEEEEEKEEEIECKPKAYVPEEHTKDENLEYLLSNTLSKTSKIIIFSEYDNTYDNILPILEKLNLKCKQLKGNTYVINNILKDYRASNNKNESINVLFLNARYYGSGLNLENTSDIIIYHKMDAALENQVVGRAQRFGRKGALNIYRLRYDQE